jgi:hypothetical protein
MNLRIWANLASTHIKEEEEEEEEEEEDMLLITLLWLSLVCFSKM